jgi:hypothetical protein
MRRGNLAAMAAADWLYLAAAPTFAFMALLTCVLGQGSPDGLCSIAGASKLGGMVPMYLLMSAFHSAPWLKLIASRRTESAHVGHPSSDHDAGGAELHFPTAGGSGLR